MKTEQIYYEDPTAERFSATVETVKPLRGSTFAVELDHTAFYPEGGGQPSDQGRIEGPNGTLSLKIARNDNGAIIHEGSLTGSLEAGDKVECELKWPRRIKYMRVHTAGHLIHDVLFSRVDGLVALRARHGDKAFLEYQGVIDESTAAQLANWVNAAIGEDLPVRSWESSREELEELCESLPPNLPQGKALRALQIGGFEPMPDGGVHVSSTGQIGEIQIHHVTVDDGKSTIRYGVR